MAEQEKKVPQEQEKKDKLDSNLKSYLMIALLVFVVFCCCILVFFLIYRYNGFASGWRKLMKVLQPIIIGLVVAYLLNPVMMFLESHLKTLFSKKIHDEKKVWKMSRGIGIALSLLLLVLIVYGLLMMVIPQLIQSITGMFTSLPDEVEQLSKWIDTQFKGDKETAAFMNDTLDRAASYFENWVQTDVLPQATTYLASITSGVISMVKLLFNTIIGLIVSVYVLMEKEKFIGQSKKIIYAIFKPERGNIIVRTVRKSNQIFGGFITGKILDSVIIGVICYVVLLIMNMPYTVLVSVIVGVTNVIPFFGPYIGAIPSFIIIALANPLQGLYFLIFIIILQQFDGNILGPKMMEAVTVNFTYPFLKKVEQLADDKTMILLCPKTTLALIGTEKAKFVDHQLEEPIGYAQACIYMIGKAHFAGQMCIKNVGYQLNHGIFKEVKLL